MRFIDFLKVTVLLMAGEATALGAGTQGETLAILECCGFWVIAGIAGALTGRKTRTSASIRELLTEARTENTLPPSSPSGVLVNRLWPFGVYALLVVPALIYPQVGGIGAAFLIYFALAWRKQEKAVTAVEERDGVRFYIRKTSPFRRIELVRTPGMRRVSASSGGT
jgi:hypothetical protein